MIVRVKLMGMLREYAPEGNLLDLSEGATVADLIAALEIPPSHVQLVTVNDQHEHNRQRSLAADDGVMLLPPAGGG